MMKNRSMCVMFVVGSLGFEPHSKRVHLIVQETRAFILND